ncbi:MAG: hypothetical protein ACI30Q_06300 [Muribaculaceae bacterium]
MKLKHVLLAIILGFVAMNVEAAKIDADSIVVTEPEFDQEIAVVTSENSSVLLPLEHGKVKTSSNIGLAMLGIEKTSMYLEFEGAMSPVTLSRVAYNGDLHFILSWKDNDLNPKRIIQILPLEIKKNRRIYNGLKSNSFTSTSEAFTQNSVKFTAKRYGEHSYLITIPRSELLLFRDKNEKEFRKFGKQYLVRIVGSNTEQMSDTEDLFTFGIEPIGSR